MNKEITQEQINQIINILYEINAPVKVFSSVKDMLEKLPMIEVSTSETAGTK